MITRTATKRINWATYKIAQNSDKVGVFVSIVSTKIPYKGAGKEYVGAFLWPVFITSGTPCPVHAGAARVLLAQQNDRPSDPQPGSSRSIDYETLSRRISRSWQPLTITACASS